MVQKSTGIFVKLLIFVTLIAATGIITYLIDNSLERKLKTDQKAINLIERNNALTNSILLNAEKIFTQEAISKKNIQESESLIDFTLTILKNGGIPPQYEDQSYLPFPGEDVLELTNETERYWYGFKKTLETIVRQSAFSVIKSQKDTVISGVNQSVTVVERVKNTAVIRAVETLNNDSEILIQKSLALASLYKTRIDNYNFKRNIAFGIAVLLVTLFAAASLRIVRKHVLQNIKFVSSEIEKLTQSEIGSETSYEFEDELTPVFTNLNQLKRKHHDFILFITNLGKGIYDSKLEYYNKQSRLDRGLIDLRDKLAQGESEAVASRLAEDQRRWAIEGQTKFNEILRVSATNVQQLADTVIKNLVLFLGAAQGGIFLKTEEDEKKYLDLISAFAYDRKKFFTKRIAFGNGLVGTAALEKNTVWLDKLPRDYMEIESGLGEAPPKSLLIVPLKTETELLGVFEIATFKSFKKEEVHFVENLAQSIAATIQSAKISERTSELLAESQKKSEELAARDAEMRQTIRELQKAKAEAEKNDAEMTALLSALDQALLSAELSVKQRIISANRQFFSKADYHFDEIDGKQFFSYFKEIEQDPDDIFKKVLEGETIRVTMKLVSKYKSEYWILGQFTPVKDASGKVSKILFLGNDITQRIETETKNVKLLEETIEKADLLAQHERDMRSNLTELIETQKEIKDKEFEVSALLSAIDLNLIKAEFSAKGKLLTANKRFVSAFRCNETELKTKNISDFFNDNIIKDFSNLSQKLILEDKPFQTGIELADAQGKTIWLSASFTPVKNEHQEINKIVFLANDISEQKQAEKQILSQKTAIEEQEYLMELNMEEMLNEQNKLTDRLRFYYETEQRLDGKFATESDKKYNEWLDAIA